MEIQYHSPGDEKNLFVAMKKNRYLLDVFENFVVVEEEFDDVADQEDV